MLAVIFFKLLLSQHNLNNFEERNVFPETSKNSNKTIQIFNFITARMSRPNVLIRYLEGVPEGTVQEVVSSYG